jgi:hypothetical protein
MNFVSDYLNLYSVKDRRQKAAQVWSLIQFLKSSAVGNWNAAEKEKFDLWGRHTLFSRSLNQD